MSLCSGAVRAHVFKFLSGAHSISLKNIGLLGGRTPILVNEDVHDLIFDGIEVKDSIPPWIAWTDVKCGKKPGHRFQGPVIELRSFTYNIEIKNCLFRNSWDGIIATKLSHHFNIHHNIFQGTRDDAVELGSGCYDIEIHNNKMLFVSKGVSRTGTASSLKPGTKFIHHNIIDCSKPMLGGRYDISGLINRKRQGMVWAAPFGSHRSGEYDKGDPWKIYNNTIIFGKELNNKGAGHTYTIKAFYPDIPHEVYNNNFIQVMDHWLSRGARVSDGSQVFDGNIYYRNVNLSEPMSSFFRLWRSSEKKQDFMSLSEFKASQFFLLSKKYYPPGWENSGIEADPKLDSKYRPDPNGIAAKGAVSLPSDWPGKDSEIYRGALTPIKQSPPQNLYIRSP